MGEITEQQFFDGVRFVYGSAWSVPGSLDLYKFVFRGIYDAGAALGAPREFLEGWQRFMTGLGLG